MPLSQPTLNKAVDIDTFEQLADAVVSRLGSVSPARITGEQRFNSLVDEITLDRFTAHYLAAYSDSLPSTGLPVSSDRINSTVDVFLLAHAVAYIKNEAGVSIAVPVNSVAPVIAGEGTGPFEVTNTGTWTNSPDSFTYQWQGDGSNITGETDDALAQDDAYDGVEITCLVTAHNEAGASTPAESNAITGAAE
jgi:hypothetical protein